MDIKRFNGGKWYLLCVGCVVGLFVKGCGRVTDGCSIGMVDSGGGGGGGGGSGDRLCVWVEIQK